MTSHIHAVVETSRTLARPMSHVLNYQCQFLCRPMTTHTSTHNNSDTFFSKCVANSLANIWPLTLVTIESGHNTPKQTWAWLILSNPTVFIDRQMLCNLHMITPSYIELRPICKRVGDATEQNNLPTQYSLLSRVV